MIRLKSPAQIEGIAAAGAIVAEVLEMATAQAIPGCTTGKLNEMAEALIRDHPGATPAFKGLYGFPATLCTSINAEVVHGIPSSRRRLEAGDIVSVDVGVKHDGLFADAAVTIPVGEVAPDTTRLLDVTQTALDVGVEAAQPGSQLGDLGWAIQTHVEAAGFSVIRELVGHGVWRSAARGAAGSELRGTRPRVSHAAGARHRHRADGEPGGTRNPHAG